MLSKNNLKKRKQCKEYQFIFSETKKVDKDKPKAKPKEKDNKSDNEDEDDDDSEGGIKVPFFPLHDLIFPQKKPSFSI